MPRLASFGHFKAQSFPPMVILVYSSSKPHVTSPKHACHCVTTAILRISTEEKAGLVWVLMYVFPFLFLSFFMANCVRTGLHSSKSETWPHYTLRGFDKDGYAHKTLHIFSIKHSMVFPNGGRIWKLGCCAIQFWAECEVLWWVRCLILLLWSRLTSEQLGIRIDTVISCTKSPPATCHSSDTGPSLLSPLLRQQPVSFVQLPVPPLILGQKHL